MVQAVSGDIDFGSTGLTAGFYNLAGKGAMRILASETQEMQSFHGGVIVASNRAYETGLRSLRDLKDHSVAITQIAVIGFSAYPNITGDPFDLATEERRSWKRG